MDDTQIPGRKTAHPRAFFTLEILACVTAALIITALAYPIAKLITGWLGP